VINKGPVMTLYGTARNAEISIGAQGKDVGVVNGSGENEGRGRIEDSTIGCAASSKGDLGFAVR